jgi:hypothetical protein
MRFAWAAVLACCTLMAAPACKREARTPVHWIGKLRSADWEVRR